LSAYSIYGDGIYLTRNRTWHEKDSPWKARQIARILERNRISASTICEVGCGAGEILRCLSDGYGPTVAFSGFEVSPQAFEICKRKERPNLHYFLKDLLNENEAFFDVVMAVDVFEHVEDYIGFIRSLRSKGGYKVFHIPLDLSVQTVLRGSPLRAVREQYGHIHYFTKEIALSALKDTGYELVDYFYTHGNLELPNLDWKKRLMKFPRRLLFTIHEDLTVRILGGFSLLVLAK
jgi:cyclopropane fatty-acyl-phospholipid synthase-like methyltransferase